MIKLKDILFEQLGDYVEPIAYNVNAVANEFNETSAGAISSGYFGMTFLTHSGKVLKFTSDPNEAAMAARLKHRPSSPHLIGIYDVRRLILPKTEDKWSDPKYQKPIWVIHMDEIIPLTKISKSAAEGYESIKYAFYSNDRTDEYIKGRIDNLLGRYGIDEKDKQILLKILSQRKTVKQDVNRFNINWSEAHLNNVGFKKPGNQFVIYDIQSKRYSDVPKEYNMGKLIDLNQIGTKYTTDGIDTPGDPDM